MSAPVHVARLGRARFAAGAIVGALVAVGTVMALASGATSVWRDLGLAVLSGGVVGGALVTVESMLSGAAEQRAEHTALLAQLATTTDLNGIDLAGRQLPDLYLPGRALVAANLAETLLDRAVLYFGDLRHARLVGASMVEAKLSGSTFANADLTDASLRSSDLDDASFMGATLDGADLRQASLHSVRLDGASLRGAHLDGAVITFSVLDGADLTLASLVGTVFERVQHDERTTWPAGFEPPERTDVAQDPISAMSLADYLAWRLAVQR